MASEALAMVEDVEPRYEAQRRALGSLLARFTADRDALMACVHEVEARVDALQSRLSAGTPAAAVDGTHAPSTSVEVEPLFAQIREEQSQSWERTKGEIESIRARAESAIQRAEQVAALVGEISERAHEIASTRVGLQGLEARFDRLHDQLSEQLRNGSGSSGQDAGAGRLVERLDHLEAMTAELRNSGARVALQALEARVERLHEQVNEQHRAASENSSPVPVIDDTALDELRNRLDRLEGIAGSTREASDEPAGFAEEVSGFRGRIDDLQSAVASLQSAISAHESVADAAVANEVLVELGERLSRLESSLEGASAAPESISDAGELRESLRRMESAVAALESRLDEAGTAGHLSVGSSGGDSDALLDDLRHQVSALREAAVSTSGIRQVWGLVSVSALVAAIGLAVMVLA